MKKEKFEVIRDYNNEVAGYKLGEYYLMKHAIWGNDYEWIINKTGQTFYFSCEWREEYEAGNIELVESCKVGKQILRERFAQ